MEPSAAYLAKVGELAYLVSELEWLVIDDMHLATTSIQAADLHGLPTGAIGRRLESAVPELSRRPNVQHFVRTAAAALLDVAARRNTVLHARPATTRAGDVLLLKLTALSDGTVDSVWIDEAYLDKQIEAVSYWQRRIEAARALPVD